MNRHYLESLQGMQHLTIFKQDIEKAASKKKTKKIIEPISEPMKEINNIKDIDFGDEKEKNHKKDKKKNKIDKNEEINYGDLRITKIDSDKNKIPQRYLMQMDVIPKHPTVALFCGSIGSGKTTLLINLLKKGQYYGKSLEGIKDNEPKPYFDTIILMSNSDDDMYEELIDLDVLKEQHIKFDPQPEDIQSIIDIQRATIDDKGLLNSPKILIIFDDVVDNQKLLRSTPFRSLFVRPRQLNCSVFLLSQYINLVPKAMRLNAINLFLFKQEKAGNDIICEQYQPSYLTKDRFMALIDQATIPTKDEPNPFLHINRRVHDKTKMFRRNLDQIIIIK